MKKLMSLTFCALMAFSLIGCGNQNNMPTANNTKVEGGSSIQIPNPFKDCGTMEEAIKLAGFNMTVPEHINGYEGQQIQAMEKEMIQVLYGTTEKEILIRKAIGSQDISGDYTSYAQEEKIKLNGIEVTVKGNSNQEHLAIWTKDGYSFSVYVSVGVDRDVLTDIVKSVQ